jgi:hypothetical protein
MALIPLFVAGASLISQYLVLGSNTRILEESNAMGEPNEETPPLIEEALELLFGLIMEFNMEEIIDSHPASALLVYFSSILRFSADLAGFLLARSYTSNFLALIYI